MKPYLLHCLFIIAIVLGCTSRERDQIPEAYRYLENLTVFSSEKEAPYQIDLVWEQSFGDTEETLIGRMGDVAVDERGRVYIADVQRMLIYVFEADGNLIAELGREGRGPGEFDYINSLQIRSDHLYIFDSNRFMVHVYSLDSMTGEKSIILAENRNQFQKLSQAFPSIYNLYVRDNDTFIAKFVSEKVEELEAWKSYETRGLLYPLDVSGKISADIVLEFPYEIRVLTTFRDGLGGIVPFTPFFGKTLTVLSGDNRIIQAVSDHFFVTYYSPSGNCQKSFYYPHEKIPLTRESVVEAGFADYFIENMSSIDLPQHWPVLTNMIIDNHDRLWIATTVEDMSVLKWWVLEDTGELITRFECPRDEPVEIVKNGYVYTRQTDEDTGLQQISRYRMEWN